MFVRLGFITDRRLRYHDKMLLAQFTLDML